MPPAPDRSGADDGTATERTPLISGPGSGSGPDHPGSDNYSSSSSHTLRAGTTTPPSEDVEAASAPEQRIGLWRAIAAGLSVWLLIFIDASNMSGMTMIQGTIAEDLQAHKVAMWFTSAYLIPLSSLAPVAGRLATIFPPRSLVLPVAAALALGGAICATARSLGAFIAGRVVAGVGGAGVLTLGVIFVLELTSEKSRGVFIGLVNAAFTFGVSFGAVVFGGLVPVMGWRAVFWLQVPYAILVGLGVFFSIPSSVEENPKHSGTATERLARIDYIGASLLVLTLVLFLYGLAGDIQPLFILVSLGTLMLFLVVEYWVARDPIIPLKVLSSRGILFSCVTQLGVMSARWSVLFYTPIFMLAVRGAGPAAAGSVLIPTNVGFGLGGILVGWLHIKRSGAFWTPSIVAVAGFCVSLYALSLMAAPDVAVAGFVVVVMVNGFAVGAGLNYTLAHALHLSYSDTQYMTTSLMATFRGFGGSFGTAIGGGIFYRYLRRGLTAGFLDLDGGDELTPARQRLVSRLLGAPGLVFGGNLGHAERRVAVDGYTAAAKGVWQAAAALCLVMVAVQAATGWTAPQKDAAADEATDDQGQTLVRPDTET